MIGFWILSSPLFIYWNNHIIFLLYSVTLANWIDFQVLFCYIGELDWFSSVSPILHFTRINSTWPQCIVLCMYCWVWFANILLRIFCLFLWSIFVCNFLPCICLVFVSVLCLPHKTNRKCPSLIFLFILLFRAALTAHGGSQARGRIGAVADDLHHSSQQCRILNPLSKARDWTCNLMLLSWISFSCATTGTPISYFLKIFFNIGDKITFILWQSQKNLNVKIFSAHLGSLPRL